MDRLWPPVLVFGLLLLGLWYYRDAFTALYNPEHDWLYLGAGLYTLFFGLFARLSRRMGYVRPFDRFLLIASPFFRFKTSYRRVRGVRSTDFYRVFDLDQLSWSQERYIAPFIGATVVVVRLSDYPVSEQLIRLFFPNYLLSGKGTEMVLIVPEWMDLSVEIDSRVNQYRDAQRARRRDTGFQRGVYQ